MNTIFQSQAEFLDAGEVTYPTNNHKDINNVNSLIKEEFEEWSAEAPYALYGELNDLKECIDLMYVCAQYMNQAVGPEKAQHLFNAVHNNNMGKCIEGKLVKSESGKILKPAGFDKMAWEKDFKLILGNFRPGPDGYAQYFIKGTWRTSGSVRNSDIEKYHDNTSEV